MKTYLFTIDVDVIAETETEAKEKICEEYKVSEDQLSLIEEMPMEDKELNTNPTTGDTTQAEAKDLLFKNTKRLSKCEQ